MKIQEIHSTSHPLLKRLKKLQRVSKEEDYFLVEGTHAIEEALACDWPLDCVVCTQRWLDNHRTQLRHFQKSCYCVPDPWLAQAVTTESPDGVAAIACAPNLATNRSDYNSFLRGLSLAIITDGVQDPGNVGTLLRSIVAVSADGLFLSEDSVHPLHPKLIRSTAGQWFRKPPQRVNIAAFLDAAKSLGIQILVASADGQSLWKSDLRRPTLLIVGSEGAGVKASVASMASGSVSIPMAQNVESLNVGIAGTLVLYESKRQRDATK